MVRIASAGTKRVLKRGFTLVEVLVAIAILTIIGIVLVNSLTLFMQVKLINTIDNHMVDAARNLASVPEKLKSCTSNDACAIFSDPECISSVSCNRTYCSDTTKCVACYVNPRNGKVFFYGFNATLVSGYSTTNYDVYKVTLCRKYGPKTKVKTFVVHVKAK